jgi:flagellar biosynthesis anti-sigma factor FlgM
MKVERPGRSAIGQLDSAKESAHAKNVEQAKARAPEEQIKVSSLSKLISEFRTSAEAVDVAKVDHLQREIHNGTFSVRPDDVAAAMLREET